ncbi:cache domain-containing protein [Paenibacillus frigoriresistens]|uniref:cache domain-containing protein n=1 Tax=Paenibacillus alginolyticus TaxID=59839 RepID=UPI001564F28A|nr:cache domain-containing protein [Paenibacillus frigoriresistens]NRF89972.1 cache domain-containing protein [Paenibacillus frigoriresistens]
MSVLRTLLGAKSLKVKMTLLLLAVSLVPLLISMLILTSQSSSVVESDTKNQQMHLAELSTSEINAWLNSKIASIQSVVKAHPEFLNGKSNTILPVLKIMAESDPEVYRFAYIDPQGMSIDTAGEKLDANKFDNFKKATVDKKVSVSEIIKEESSGKNIIIIDVPLVDSKGDFRGIVQSFLFPEQILSIINHIKFGETGYGYLLSPSGTYLVHPKKTGQKLEESSTAEKMALYKNTVFKDQSGYILYTEPDGTLKSAAYQTIEATGWKYFDCRAFGSIQTGDSFKEKFSGYASCFCAGCHCYSYDRLTDDDSPNHDNFIPHAASRAGRFIRPFEDAWRG